MDLTFQQNYHLHSLVYGGCLEQQEQLIKSKTSLDRISYRMVRLSCRVLDLQGIF